MEVIIISLVVFAIVMYGIAALIDAATSKEKKVVPEETRRKNAQKAVERSNENLSKYIDFIREHEPNCGLPDKVLGTKKMQFLHIYEDGQPEPDVSGLFPNPYGIKCENVSMSWASSGSYISKLTFPPIDDLVIIYANSRAIVLYGKLYKFDDILSYEVMDNSNQIIVGGQVNATTTTDNGSMIGRGLVGGLIGGPAGAVIGASTASKTTTAQLPDQEVVTKHSYVVYVSVRDIAKPMLKFYYGSNRDAVQEFVSILNIVCNKG